jgi:hypothetical protein
MVELEFNLFLPQKSKLKLGSSRAPFTKKKTINKKERKKERKRNRKKD